MVDRKAPVLLCNLARNKSHVKFFLAWHFRIFTDMIVFRRGMAEIELPDPLSPQDPGESIRQEVYRTPAGRVLTATLSDGVIREPVLRLQMTQAEYDNLSDFIDQEAEGALNEFEYVDQFGASLDVHYVSGLPGEQAAYDDWEVTLELVEQP